MFFTMLTGRGLSVILAGVALALISIISVSTLFLRYRKNSSSNNHGVGRGAQTEKLYEDEDGIATDESQQKYSATISRYFILFVPLAGSLVSLSLSVYSTIYPGHNLFLESWMTFGSWVLYASCCDEPSLMGEPGINHYSGNHSIR